MIKFRDPGSWLPAAVLAGALAGGAGCGADKPPEAPAAPVEVPPSAATVAAGGFSAGGNIGLRVNKTGHEIDETVTLAGQTMRIQFGPGETDLLEFFGAGLSLNIGSFVTLEGDIVLPDAGNGWQVFGANKALLFVGQGPLRLYEGRDEINPSASGLLIRNARVGVVRNAAAGTFVIKAELEKSKAGEE